MINLFYHIIMEEKLRELYSVYVDVRKARMELQKKVKAIKKEDVEGVDAIKLLASYLNIAHDEDKAYSDYEDARNTYIESGKDITKVFEDI